MNRLVNRPASNTRFIKTDEVNVVTDFRVHSDFRITANSTNNKSLCYPPIREIWRGHKLVARGLGYILTYPLTLM